MNLTDAHNITEIIIRPVIRPDMCNVVQLMAELKTIQGDTWHWPVSPRGHAKWFADPKDQKNYLSVFLRRMADELEQE